MGELNTNIVLQSAQIYTSSAIDANSISSPMDTKFISICPNLIVLKTARIIQFNCPNLNLLALQSMEIVQFCNHRNYNPLLEIRKLGGCD